MTRNYSQPGESEAPVEVGESAERVVAEPEVSERPYKRPFDLTILVLAHALLFPLWALLWTLIPFLVWLEDRGPILYVQRRVGRGGQTFGLFKFRSMYVRRAGEDWSGHTTTNDPRITRVGRLLRRTALDELPQIINLWRGDISFVGPRALPLDMHEGYVNEEPDFPLRLQVRPGLTGMSQINLPRRCSVRERLTFDLLYIHEASPYLDVKLIISSVWLTLTGQWGTGTRE